MESISTIQQAAKRATNAGKNIILRNLYNALNNVKMANGGVIGYGVISNLITTAGVAAPFECVLQCLILP